MKLTPWQPPVMGSFDVALIIGLFLLYLYMEFCL
jgi:hypothetical protein